MKGLGHGDAQTCMLAAVFRGLGVENSVAYFLGILDHVKEVLLNTFTEVGLPLVIGFSDTSICAKGEVLVLVSALMLIAFRLRQDGAPSMMSITNLKGGAAGAGQ